MESKIPSRNAIGEILDYSDFVHNDDHLKDVQWVLHSYNLSENWTGIQFGAYNSWENNYWNSLKETYSYRRKIDDFYYRSFFKEFTLNGFVISGSQYNRDKKKPFLVNSGFFVYDSNNKCVAIVTEYSVFYMENYLEKVFPDITVTESDSVKIRKAHPFYENGAITWMYHEWGDKLHERYVERVTDKPLNAFEVSYMRLNTATPVNPKYVNDIRDGEFIIHINEETAICFEEIPRGYTSSLYWKVLQERSNYEYTHFFNAFKLKDGKWVEITEKEKRSFFKKNASEIYSIVEDYISAQLKKYNPRDLANINWIKGRRIYSLYKYLKYIYFGTGTVLEYERNPERRRFTPFEDSFGVKAMDIVFCNGMPVCSISAEEIGLIKG